MTGTKKPIRIRIVSDTQLDTMAEAILTLISKANITYYDAFGLLEIVKNELTLNYFDSVEGDDNNEGNEE